MLQIERFAAAIGQSIVVAVSCLMILWTGPDASAHAIAGIDQAVEVEGHALAAIV